MADPPLWKDDPPAIEHDPNAKPGWYAMEGGGQQYWDGTDWTDFFAPPAPPTPPPEPRSR